MKHGPTLRDWRKGDPLSAAHWQEVVDAARSLDDALSRVEGKEEDVVVRGKPRLGIIVAKGPKREADYTDRRYWVKFAYIDETEVAAKVRLTEDLDNPPVMVSVGGDNPKPITEPIIITATNIAEPSDWHTLGVDREVQIWTYFERSETGKPHYLLFIEPKRGTFRVALTQTSGSRGSSTTPASWVYTANDPITDAELGTGLSPLVRTWPFAADDADWGLADYDEDGDLALVQAFEPLAQGAC